jgi:hypothetical protein
MARVQTAEAMGNIQFDPGIAQSVLTNKEIQSRERTAMAQMDTQKQISAGDQAASMSNAGTQANASMFNTAQGIAGESNMQSQRLAAQAGAQASQQSFEKQQRMMDQQYAEARDSERAGLEIALQRGMQSWQDDRSEKNWVKANELYEKDKEWSMMSAMATVKMKLNLYKAIQQQGGSWEDTMKIYNNDVERGKSINNHNKVIDHQTEATLSPEILDPILSKNYLYGDGTVVDPKTEAPNMKAMRSRDVVGALLKNTGMDAKGLSADIVAGGTSSMANWVKEKQEAGMQPVELAGVLRFLDKGLKTIDPETKDETMKLVRSHLSSARIGIMSSGMGKESPLRDFVESAEGMEGGYDPDDQLFQHVQKGGTLVDIDKIMGDYLESYGAFYGKGSANQQKYGTAFQNIQKQLQDLAGGQQGYNTTLPTDKLGYTEQMGPPQDLQAQNERERTALTGGLKGRYTGK